MLKDDNRFILQGMPLIIIIALMSSWNPISDSKLFNTDAAAYHYDSPMSAISFHDEMLDMSSFLDSDTINFDEKSILRNNPTTTDNNENMPLPNSGVYIPLYRYPSGSGWSDWAEVIDAKNEHSSVPIVATINPSNGVGTDKDENFANGITKLKAAGVIVLGYIATDYGTKDPAKVKNEISKYMELYDVDGVMFDEMPSKTGYENYYRELSNYAESLGMEFTKGNPGRNMSPTYVGAVDNLSIYEGEGYPSMSDLSPYHPDYERSNFSFCAYGVPSLDEDFIIEASRYVSLMCITDDNLPNPYNSLPSYFPTLVSMLDTTR